MLIKLFKTEDADPSEVYQSDELINNDQTCPFKDDGMLMVIYLTWKDYFY